MNTRLQARHDFRSPEEGVRRRWRTRVGFELTTGCQIAPVRQPATRRR